MTFAGRTAAPLCALLASTALTAPAWAQSVYQHVDRNGVDVVDGSFNLSLVEGSIGSGDGAIVLTRTQGVGGAADNINIRLTRQVSGGQAAISIVIGNRMETFTGAATATSYTSGQAEGATLTRISYSQYEYRDAGGSVTNFEAPPGLTNAGNNGYCSTASQVSCGLIATSTVHPNGRTETYEWDVGENCTQTGNDRNGEPIYECAQFWRQRGMANSYGYAVRFSFVQEANPTSGLPPVAWHTRSGATLSNAAISGAPNRSVTYATPSTGVTDITTDGGLVWRLTRDTQARITGVRRPGFSSDNTTISYAAGTSPIVSSVTTDGITTNYSRSVSGSTGTMTVTDAGSNVTTITSNLTIGRPTSVTNALSETTTYGYDGSGRPTTILQPQGDLTDFTYDARGNVTQTRRWSQSGSSYIANSATYPSSCSNPVTCNQPLTTTDALSNVTDYEYDATHGGVTRVTQPAPSGGAVRPQVRTTYTQVNGEYQPTAIAACQTQAGASGGTPAVCAGGTDEVVTELSYDTNGNVTGITRRDGASTLVANESRTYDAHGNMLTVDGPVAGSADTTRYRYDAARRITGVIGPDPDAAGALRHRATRMIYHANGQVSQVLTGSVASQSDADWAAISWQVANATAYNANGRAIAQVIGTPGNVIQALTEISYDALGRVDCVARRMNPPATLLTYTPTAACSTTTAGSFGEDRITRTTYDALGRPTQVQSGYGVSGQTRTVVSTTYTANGRVATVTDGENNRTSYAYDGFDGLYRTYYPVATQGAATSSTTDYEELGYDLAGQVTSRRLRDGSSITYSYDALGRLTLRNLPSPELDVTYAYDNFGRMTSAAHANQTLTFGFDALGRNTSQAGQFGTIGYEYDLAGRRTRMTWPDSFYVTYDYNDAGDLLHIRENGATSGVGVLATFAYDNLGRRTSLTRGNGTTTSYSYGTDTRLSSLAHDMDGTGYDVTLGFSYNPAGQIVANTRSNDNYSWTAHYNTNRAYTANGLNQYTASGSVTPTYDSRGNVTSAGSTTYSYSSENMLSSSSDGAGLNYDPLERLARTTDGTVGVRFAYDGQIMATEYNASNAIIRRYVHGPGVDEPIVWYEGSDTSDRRFLYADERGSVIAVGNSSGTVTNVNSYDEYGIPGSGNVGRFGYTGQAWLPEIGMYHYRARIYSPRLGRFMQTDPIGYNSGMNLYAYVSNDPLNFVDPLGLKDKPTEEPVDGGVIYVDSVGDIIVTGTRSNGGGSSGGVRITSFGPSFYGGGGGGGASQANEERPRRRGGRRGPTTRCPGINQPCGAPTAAGGTNPNYPNVCPECLGRNQQLPGRDVEVSWRSVVGGVVIGGAIAAGLIFLPEITIPALIIWRVSQ